MALGPRVRICCLSPRGEPSWASCPRDIGRGRCPPPQFPRGLGTAGEGVDLERPAGPHYMGRPSPCDVPFAWWDMFHVPRSQASGTHCGSDKHHPRWVCGEAQPARPSAPPGATQRARARWGTFLHLTSLVHLLAGLCLQSTCPLCRLHLSAACYPPIRGLRGGGCGCTPGPGGDRVGCGSLGAPQASAQRPGQLRACRPLRPSFKQDVGLMGRETPSSEKR